MHKVASVGTIFLQPPTNFCPLRHKTHSCPRLKNVFCFGKEQTKVLNQQVTTKAKPIMQALCFNCLYTWNKSFLLQCCSLANSLDILAFSFASLKHCFSNCSAVGIR